MNFLGTLRGAAPEVDQVQAQNQGSTTFPSTTIRPLQRKMNTGAAQRVSPLTRPLNPASGKPAPTVSEARETVRSTITPARRAEPSPLPSNRQPVEVREEIPPQTAMVPYSAPVTSPAAQQGSSVVVWVIGGVVVIGIGAFLYWLLKQD